MISFEQFLPTLLEATIVGSATPDDATAYLPYIQTHLLVLNGARQWDGNLVEFVQSFDGIGLKRLTIFGPTGLDITCLSKLNELVELNVAGLLVGELDLDWFPKLERFGFGAEIKGKQHVKLRWGSSSNLRSTGMLGSKLPPIDTLASLPMLESLNIVKATFNPSELSKLTNIAEIYFSYWNAIQSLSDISSMLPRLRRIRLYRASKLTDYEAIKTASNLKTLDFESCPPISSVSLFEPLDNLEKLYLIGTKIIDGDITPLKRMKRLVDVALIDQKNMIPSRKEIEEFFKSKRLTR